MAQSFVKRVAEDLMHLEVNTIIKSQMSGTKVPDTNREAMYDIAGTYSSGLRKIGMRYLPPDHAEFANGFRGKEVWKFGGIMSFRELRNQASKWSKWLETEAASGRIKLPDQEAKDQLAKDEKMLERIQTNSHRIIGIFKGKMVKANAQAQDAALKSADPANGSEDTKGWNNDLSRAQINRSPDLNLDIKDMMLIRKAWDIGTEEIVMQTIVGIDGDVTTRILEKFSKDPNATVIKLHDDALKTSISFWYKMVDVVVKIGGKALDKVLGENAG